MMVKLRFPKSPFRGGGATAEEFSSTNNVTGRRSSRIQQLRYQNSQVAAQPIQGSEADAVGLRDATTSATEGIGGTRHQIMHGNNNSNNIGRPMTPSNNLNYTNNLPLPILRTPPRNGNPPFNSYARSHPRSYNNHSAFAATANQRRPFDATNACADSFSPISSGGVASGLRRMLSPSTRKKKQRTFNVNSPSSSSAVAAAESRANNFNNPNNNLRRATSSVVNSISSSTGTNAMTSNREDSTPVVQLVRLVSNLDGDDVAGDGPNENSIVVGNLRNVSSSTIPTNNETMSEMINQGTLDHFDSYETEEGMDTSDDDEGSDEVGDSLSEDDGAGDHGLRVHNLSEDKNKGTFSHATASSTPACQHSTFSGGKVATSGMDIDSVDVDADGVKSSSKSVFKAKGILDWMKDDAPKDVLPKILSFLGSRKLDSLSRVSRTWNVLVRDESVWRVLCEDTHKWSVGDNIPRSWIQLYKDNPCVPIDYDTVEAAMGSVSSGRQMEVSENNIRYFCREQRTSSRILLHPGPYFLRRSLVFNCIGRTELTLETVKGFLDPEHAMKWCRHFHKSSIEFSTPLSSSIHSSSESSYLSSTTSSEVRRSTSLRQLFGCRSASSAIDTSTHGNSDEDFRRMSDRFDAPVFVAGHSSRAVRSGGWHGSCYQGPNPAALLVLESRRENEPVIRIRQGSVHLRGLKLVHYCLGNDIWNGNAAIQVQSPFGDDDRPIEFIPPSIAPTAKVSDCDIVSLSGRGFVNIDGGISFIDNCNIHNSAATGIYVGGAGSVATITCTDVIENGNGNERTPRGVARGHSGIYVEQGIAKIRDCNISKNSLTGISAVSNDHATLQLERSDIVSNGSVQLELPPIGSPSRGRSFTRNNNISATGHGRPRSRYVKEQVAAAVAESPGVPIGGHFPPLPQSPSEFPNDSVVNRARYTGNGELDDSGRAVLF